MFETELARRSRSWFKRKSFSHETLIHSKAETFGVLLDVGSYAGFSFVMDRYGFFYSLV